MNNSVSPGRLVNSMRAAVIGTAVVGIVLGLIALLWPRATLLTVAFFFGVSLIIAGLFRVFLGFSAHKLPSRTRWLLGILGALVVIAVFTLPGLAIATFVTVGAILLIVVSVATLFALPRRAKVG
ncbi:MAG: DUF308 domain-containing protein [Nakamurella sp.]